MKLNHRFYDILLVQLVEPLLSGHLLNGQPLLNGQLSKSQYQNNTVNKTPIKRPTHIKQPLSEGGRLIRVRLYR